MYAHVQKLDLISMQDLSQVGGKNASLGEMIKHLKSLGVEVPTGFTTTAFAFQEFMQENNLQDSIYDALDKLDINNVKLLAQIGKSIRDKINNAQFNENFKKSISQEYNNLVKTIGNDQFSVAVRSSATAEDLPNASFAGQQETYLNVQGLDNILIAIKKVFASLFNDRAIAYRVHQGFNHREVFLSAGIQYMVRSDKASSGVMFSIDTESGFDKIVLINSSYGLGELVVQGAVNPDEFYVYKENILAKKPAILRKVKGQKAKQMIYADNAQEMVKTIDVSLELQQQFSLDDKDIEELAAKAIVIEKHYGRPMDIEWAKDGISGKLYIVQARPETVNSRQDFNQLERYCLSKRGDILTSGRSVGQRIGQGMACVVDSIHDMHKVQEGDVLVTDMTDPDWEPVMKKAAAIVTNRGGRTCHAAIIARELGIPAVVGCVSATKAIHDKSEITVSCAEGDIGYIYKGILPFTHEKLTIDTLPKLPINVLLNLGNPEKAFSFQAIPNAGVGLARLEFLISNNIGIHPNALLNYNELKDQELKQAIDEKILGYPSPVEYYVAKLTEGIATIAAAFAPKPVIVRLSDFKSNEYAHLLGGNLYEPIEENPMIGYRGASRYVSPQFKEAFSLECKAIRRVREDMGLTNVEVMIPFVRTVDEACAVTEVLAKNSLERGKNGLRLIMMCEVPSNALLAEEFLQYFDGFSIGSNDLTQLTLGLDRDSGLVAHHFDERNNAVKALLQMAISACKKQKKYIGICGQGPSDHKDFAKWLIAQGIDSISLNPDSVVETCLFLARE